MKAKLCIVTPPHQLSGICSNRITLLLVLLIKRHSKYQLVWSDRVTYGHGPCNFNYFSIRVIQSPSSTGKTEVCWSKVIVFHLFSKLWFPLQLRSANWFPAGPKRDVDLNCCVRGCFRPSLQYGIFTIYTLQTWLKRLHTIRYGETALLAGDI